MALRLSDYLVPSITYKNNPDDFSMPYKIYGSFDKQVMLEKYNQLTNEPKNYLHVRLNK